MNYEFLINALTAQIVTSISKIDNVSLKIAFEKFYSSNISKQLENKKTLLYLQGADYILEEYQQENSK